MRRILVSRGFDVNTADKVVRLVMGEAVLGQRRIQIKGPTSFRFYGAIWDQYFVYY